MHLPNSTAEHGMQLVHAKYLNKNVLLFTQVFKCGHNIYAITIKI